MTDKKLTNWPPRRAESPPPVLPTGGRVALRAGITAGTGAGIGAASSGAPFGVRRPMASPFEMSSRSLNESRPGRDDVIRGTDDDAFISKLSAVNLGYLDDPFVKHFVKRPSRRPPIINRGSYLRTTMLDNLMANFLKNDSRLDQGSSTGGAASSSSTTTVPLIKKQIVSLGCGSDTRYFKLKANGLSAHKYFEIDFAESTAKKAITIKKNKKLLDIIADPDHKLGLGGTEFYSKDYSLLSGDLREFVDSIVPKLKAQGFDTSLPTLFLSECVLIYIQPRDSDDIVDWVGTNMDAALFVVYEQINPSDPFGAMMLRNLKARQIELPGIHAYPSLKSQEERFMSRGWISAKAVDMNTLHDSISEAEMKRISALEIFDEVEEWQLLAQHYCIAWAYNVKKDLGSPPRHDQSQASGQEQLLEAGRLSIQSGYDRSLIISLFAKAVQ